MPNLGNRGCAPSLPYLPRSPLGAGRRAVGEGLAGHVVETGKILNISDPYRHPRFNPELDKKSGFRTRNILSLPIRDKAGEIIAALQLLNKADGDFSAENVEFLLPLSGHIGLAIENAQLHREAVEKQRMERELSVAQHIQNGLLPESVPKLEGFDIAVLNQPSLTVGGDYYDFLSLGPQTVLTVVADVQDKEVSADHNGRKPIREPFPGFQVTAGRN